MTYKNDSKKLAESIKSIDNELSKRFIQLDPTGYCLIKIDPKRQELIVEHFTNNLDEHGVAIDPETGKPLKCSGDLKRIPTQIIKGKTAKEIGIKLTEGKTNDFPSRLDHALYLGRELQKAEICLIEGSNYIQD
tara:strand:- start:180 stop:581 length:402 start_codon:yes stop_codon:yes gene_type:complete